MSKKQLHEAGASEGDRRGLSLVGAGRAGAVVRTPQGLGRSGAPPGTDLESVPRSTVYAQRERRDPPTSPGKRGPKTAWTDEALTAEIRTVIAASPFHGEGHRKIWARLRVVGVRTSKRRVLRVLRAADPLGPARAARLGGGAPPMTARSSPTH